MSEKGRKALKEQLNCAIVDAFYNDKLSIGDIRKQMQTALAETLREIQSDVEGMKKRMR